MDLQPGVYRIKRRVTGQFMSIETVARPPEPSLEEGYEGGALGGLAAVGGGRGSEKDLCRGAAGRTLEFACGNLFDVTDIAQVCHKSQYCSTILVLRPNKQVMRIEFLRSSIYSIV